MRTLAIAAAIAATTAVAAAIAASSPANATSGPGCLRVVNVAPWDVLHLRKRPNPNSRSVAQLDPKTGASCISTPRARPNGNHGESGGAR